MFNYKVNCILMENILNFYFFILLGFTTKAVSRLSISTTIITVRSNFIVSPQILLF